MTGISWQERQWRVRREFAMLKWAAAIAFCVVGVVLTDDARGLILCEAAGLLLGAFALRDVLAPVRLAAGDQGVVVVSGFSRRVLLPWPEITHIRVGKNARYGLRWELLEIETGDGLHLVSSHELGAPVVEVADELFRLRRQD